MEKTRKVKQNRSAVLYIILHLLTFSLYDWFFFSSVVKDVNQICEKDGECSPGDFWVLILSPLTFGIPQYIWLANMIDRLADNAWRYNAKVKKNRNKLMIFMLFFPEFGYGYTMGVFINILNCLAKAYSRIQEVEKSSTVQNDKIRARKLSGQDKVSNHSSESKNDSIKESNKSELIDELIQDMIPGLMKSDLQENNASTSGYRKLLGLTGKYLGTEIPIGPNQKIILGRDASAASLVVNGEKISRVHCSIQFSEGAQNNYIITDHSSNGVLLMESVFHVICRYAYQREALSRWQTVQTNFSWNNHTGAKRR